MQGLTALAACLSICLLSITASARVVSINSVTVHQPAIANLLAVTVQHDHTHQPQRHLASMMSTSEALQKAGAVHMAIEDKWTRSARSLLQRKKKDDTKAWKGWSKLKIKVKPAKGK